MLGCRCAWCHRWPFYMTLFVRHPSWLERRSSQFLQEILQSRFGATKLAFPNDEYDPASVSQCFNRLPIPLNIAFKLGSPKFRARLGKHCIAAARMPVPKTAMYKYTAPQAWQYNVWLSGEVRSMKSKAESLGMQKPAYQHFGLRVLPPYGRHHARPAGRINYVHFAPF